MSTAEPPAEDAIVWIRCDAEWPGGDSTDYVAIPRAEWAQRTEAEREVELVEMATETLTNSGCGAGACVVSADEVPADAKARALS